jgi:hypothetical protein
MRLKARPDLHYAPVPDGVYFSGTRGEFVMRGWEFLFAVADICVPLLETGTTEDDLVSTLGGERARPVVRYLTGGLREHGMLLDLARLTVPEPEHAVRACFAEPIALLESLSDDPYAAFAAVRAATVLLIGPPNVVRPAMRGLTRAGVGEVVVVTSEAEMASRRDVAAILWCHDGERLPRFPEGVPVVPVILGQRCALSGPALRNPAENLIWTALSTRVRAWADAERLGPLARPVADALAGSFAAQLVFDELAGIATGAAAHVVHGEELAADRITVDFDGWPLEGARTLDDVEPAPLPSIEDAVESAAAVTQRWTGLFASVSGDTLPQMPLALREIEHRDGAWEPVRGWALDQRGATVAVTLDALRRSCVDTGVGAAGLTAQRWLLDGALRLLVADARPAGVVTGGDLGAETNRIRRSLTSLDPVQSVIRILRVPGVDWPLGCVESAETGEIFGMAWASDVDQAARNALGTALARAQLRGGTVAVVNTDALLSADDSVVESLRRQVVNAGRTYRGRPRRRDPVLGQIAFWFGPVHGERRDAS